MLITLSDGKPCQIRRLGLFDLDGVGPELSGPFRYMFKLASGQEAWDEYDLSRIKTPPAPVVVPESEVSPGTPLWHQLHEWQVWKAAIVHDRERYEKAAAYVKEVSNYLITNCVSEADRSRFVEAEDWRLLYEAALVPRLTEELLADCLRRTYKAGFEDKEIFEAMDTIEPGRGRYDAIALWENQLMVEMRLTDDEYGLLSLAERARKVLAPRLPKLMEALESDRMMKEMERKNGPV